MTIGLRTRRPSLPVDTRGHSIGGHLTNVGPQTLRAICRLSVLATVACAAGEVPPYGAADFVPSAQTPIYFRAGNGYYPGATPPTEWWEGTPVQRDGQAGDNWGNRKPTKLWDCADDKSKNILWKVPVPGWTLSHPIVVGTRVFLVGEPHFVACYDARTGKQLWQREALPLLLDGVPEERARTLQVALDLARALYLAVGRGPSALTSGLPKGGAPEDPAKFVAAKRAAAGKLVAMLLKHRPTVESSGDSDLLQALDSDLALLREAEGLSAANAEGITAWIKKLSKFPNLKAACERKLKVQMGGAWWGYVGSADSTLASDGARVYGVFQEGQVFCYDLDGKLLWGQRQQCRHDNRFSFCRSPLLHGEVLILKDIRADRWLGLDKLTGKTRWETPLGSVANNFWMSDVLMRLRAPDGAVETVMLTNQGRKIIRARDGKILGEFPIGDRDGRGQNMVVLGDTAAMGTAADNFTGPSTVCRVRLTGPDTAAAEIVRTLDEKPLSKLEPHAATAEFIVTTCGRQELRLISPVDGQVVGRARGLRGTPTVAGKYVIMAVEHGDAGQRKRDDRKALARYAVVDISDPRNPKLISDRNVLAYRDPPADYIVKNYLSEFDPLDFAGCYWGSAAYFTEQLGGVVPHGSRLYIQSSAYLYCIGDPKEAQR